MLLVFSFKLNHEAVFTFNVSIKLRGVCYLGDANTNTPSMYEALNKQTHWLITQQLRNTSTHQLKTLNYYLLFYNIALIFTPF